MPARPTRFQPSEESSKVLRALKYLKQASTLLEKQLQGEEVPSWVEDSIVQSAISLSLAVGFGQNLQEKKQS